MRQQYLLFLESNTTGTGRLFLNATKDLGLSPVLVTREPDRYDYVAEEHVDVLRVDTTDYAATEAAVLRFAELNSVAGIYSSSEYWIEAAARLAKLLGLPGANPDAVALARNKWRQRERLEERSLPVPGFCRLTSTQYVELAVDCFSFPVIVKPTQGSGSVGVRLCRTLQEVKEQAAYLLAQTANERGLPIQREVLLEQYIIGPEYSVELFGLVPLGVTRKYLSPEPYFIEVGHDFPADISAETSRVLKEAAIHAVQAVDLTWGPIHVEVRLTHSGPMVVEINPRLAGGFIPELVRQSLGVDLIRNTVLAVTGCTPEWTMTRRRHASIRFLVPPSQGVLSAVRGTAAAAKREGVCEVMLYRRIGEYVSSHGDFRDRLGHVIACGDSSQNAMRAAEQACEMVIVEVANNASN